MKNIYEQIDRNKMRSTLVIVFFMVFVTTAIYFIGRAFGYSESFFGLALIISGAFTFISYWNSDKIILVISGARPSNNMEDRLLNDVIDNLCIATGLPHPKVYVIEDSAPNAFATGRDEKNAVICVTSGLLDKLNRTELEGVIAHEMSHIKNYDMLLMSLVSIMVGMLTLMSDWMIRSRFRRSRNNDSGQAGLIIMIIGFVLLLLSPIIAQLIQLAISRRREFLADAGSAMITRQPSGLISALQKISADKEPLEAANKATAHLYIINPLKNKHDGVGWFSGLFNTHPPVEERIKALQGQI